MYVWKYSVVTVGSFQYDFIRSPSLVMGVSTISGFPWTGSSSPGVLTLLSVSPGRRGLYRLSVLVLLWMKNLEQPQDLSCSSQNVQMHLPTVPESITWWLSRCHGSGASLISHNGRLKVFGQNSSLTSHGRYTHLVHEQRTKSSQEKRQPIYRNPRLWIKVKI